MGQRIGSPNYPTASDLRNILADREEALWHYEYHLKSRTARGEVRHPLVETVKHSVRRLHLIRDAERTSAYGNLQALQKEEDAAAPISYEEYRAILMTPANLRAFLIETYPILKMTVEVKEACASFEQNRSIQGLLMILRVLMIVVLLYGMTGLILLLSGS